MSMCNIIVGRYTPSEGPLPEGVHDVCESWQGWIEDEKGTWIMFVSTDGKPVVFLNRDPETGAVLQ